MSLQCCLAATSGVGSDVPDAATLNAELHCVIDHSNLGGWQSSRAWIRWGGTAIKLLAFRAFFPTA